MQIADSHYSIGTVESSATKVGGRGRGRGRGRGSGNRRGRGGGEEGERRGRGRRLHHSNSVIMSVIAVCSVQLGLEIVQQWWA